MSRPFSECVHPDDLQSTQEVLARLLRGNDVIGFEHRIICADGSVRWLQWNTRTIPERGFAYCIGRDVTDRRRADDDLAASRARIVTATDEERRRVVRDLHDGPQQRLVHTVITLKLARRALGNEETAAAALVSEALDHAERAMTELRELAHGILPAVLTHGGLRAGVEALASRVPLPVDNGVSVGRLPAEVEATAYFVVSDALTDVAKHARAGHAKVMARIEDDTLAVQVRDDGVGGARPDGSGLVGLADRLAALDGELRVESPADGGTLIAAAIPLADSLPELQS